ncbi:MAG: DMT family transporter [Proteobacteria bacterium]|nr:DMT family transporter [Pseudomonadota bacterium]MBU1581693.1 DMT family transporter [Pseudomonadota bacterium]MBU2455028.1 DMT family transporter [Pseudomonadota bacterium]MBU2629263.1 DMT family transporter [Pseudomonadota bacterium]
MQAKAQLDVKVLIGCFCVFGSAFFFYLATVIIKWARIKGLQIDPSFFVFSRFLLGFVSVLILMAFKKKKIKVVKKHYLIGRTIANCVAVYCFFKGVDLTSVAQANILNMTYPLFITIFSWIFLKEQRDIIAVFIVILAFTGVFLILAPKEMSFHLNSLWALASGVSAAIAIMYLNLSRQVHDTETTLFFLFGLGSVLIFIVFFDQIHLPQMTQLKYLLLCSFSAIIGQYLITLGFKYVTAVEGGIISSTRILLAAVLGPAVAMDPALSVSGWAGAFLIFVGNVYLTLKKTRR